MPRPDITLLCELESPALERLFAQRALLDELASQHHSIALAILDFSTARTSVVRCLNERGVPVVAWLLLPPEAGYWLNLTNYPQAVARYQEFQEWAARERLHFAAVALHFEPTLASTPMEAGPLLIFNRAAMAQQNALYPAAQQAYLELAAAIRYDGYEVHTYQLPMLVDDRRAGTTLIQRTFDIVDVPADQEVLMLYSSTLPRALRSLGGAYVRSYAQHADGIAVGITGGNVVDMLTGSQARRMSLKAFRRDLRIAAQYTDTISIFSLEGCVERGWLHELRTIPWDTPIAVPPLRQFQMGVLRNLIGFGLWLSRYGLTALGWLGWLVAAGMWLSGRVRGWQRRRRS